MRITELNDAVKGYLKAFGKTPEAITLPLDVPPDLVERCVSDVAKQHPGTDAEDRGLARAIYLHYCVPEKSDVVAQGINAASAGILIEMRDHAALTNRALTESGKGIEQELNRAESAVRESADKVLDGCERIAVSVKAASVVLRAESISAHERFMFWKKCAFAALALLGLLVISSLASHAQQNTNTNIIRVGGDIVNPAAGIPVFCISGCSGGAEQDVDLIKYLNSPVSATNPIAIRQSDGTSFYDGRQIRALTSSDTVTVVQATGTNLHIVCDSGCGSSTFADNAAFTFGTTSIGNMGAVVDDVATNTVAENSAGAPRMTASRILYVDISQTTANATAIKVDGSAVTQPVSGTVTVTDGAGALNVIVDSGTLTAVTAITNALPAGTNNIGDVDILSIAAGDNNIGNVDIVTMPSVTIGTFPDNEPFNVAQWGGTATTLGQKAMTASVPVVLASDQSSVGVTLAAETTKVIGTVRNLGNAGAIFDGATGAAPPANVVYVGGLTSGATGGLLGGITICNDQAVVDVTTATTTLLITGVSGRQVRICAYALVTTAANNIAFISGTGATCGTSTAAMTGGTTAAEGFNLAANSGIAHGSGIGMVLMSIDAGDSVCIVTSAATQLSGHISYTIY